MSIVGSNILAGSSGQQGYQISRSVRLRSSASAYFNRTQAAGNQTTWTFSGWVKLGALSGTQYLMQSGGSSGSGVVYNVATNDLQVEIGNGTTQYYARTSAVFRDPSAWYHVVAVADTNNATSTDRLRLYVNGVRQTIGASSFPTSGFTGYMNQNSVAANIGRWNGSTPNYYFDGYLTEINFIDGQALTPSSFGETDAVTGVWKPKKYAGTYGTNGFYLNFSDNSNNTAATIGKDYSGNGNNWTPNNISVTAGVTYDSMIDTPTPYADGGNGRGNYCVLNPLVAGTASYISGGNLNASVSATNTSLLGTFQFPPSGKWYFEYQITTIGGGSSPMGGVASTTSNSPAVFYRTDGTKLVDGTGSAYGASYTTTDTIGVAVDIDGGTVTFYKNNTSQGALTYAASGFYPVLRSNAATDAFNINFGQRPFSYTPPTGFKALNTQNLPDATIKKGSLYFDATLWNGTGATDNTVTNSGSMQPDMLWVKSRSLGGGGNHMLVDSVRGVGTSTSTKEIYPNLTNAESLSSSVTSFNSNGFTLTGGTGVERYNASGNTYVGWQWKANGSAVTNTAGSITSTVSANTTAGFSIVTYTGTGANATVGHGLGVAPAMMIVKRRDAVSAWDVYHKSIGATGRLYLNTTDATNTSSAPWNDTAPTSSVFTVGTATDTNASGSAIVAYLFAEVAGFSKFGSVTMNSSADGAFVFTGFLPKLVMLKRTDSTSNWIMWDTVRNTYNVVGAELYPNLSNAESTVTDLDILSNGFKMRNSGFSGTWIYAAWAAAPFKNSLAR